MNAPFQIQVRADTAWLTVSGMSYDEVAANLAGAIGTHEADAVLGKFSPVHQAVGQLADGGITGAATYPANGYQQQGAPPAAPQGGYGGPPTPPAPPASPPQGYGQQQAAPQGGGPAPDWKDRAASLRCGHNLPRRAYEGTNRNGAYYAYFCGAPREVPREEQCKAIDAITMKEWK